VLFHQVDHHRRVDAAGTAGHDQAIGRRHAHRGVDRAAVVDGAQRGADAEVAGDDLQLAERALEYFGRLQRNVAVRGAVEAVAADAILLVKVVGQAVEVGVGRQGLVEGGVEDGDMRQVRELLHGLADAVHIDRVVQWRKNRKGFDIGDDRRRDDHCAGELAAAMDDAVADGGDVLGWKVKASPSRAVASCITLNRSESGKRGAFLSLDLRAHHDRDVCSVFVGVVDDAMDVGAESWVS
jgi:hypothetical protein